MLIKPGVSEEQFYRWADEDSNWEYLDGRIIVHSPASYSHEDLFAWFLVLLRSVCEAQEAGVVLGSRFPMRLDERWSPEPDLLFVREEHRDRIGPQRLEGPADWVIEILSPDTRKLDLEEKRVRYQEAGIGELWFVDREAAEIHVDLLEHGQYRTEIRRDGRLQSISLPAFWVELAWLAGERLPPTAGCLDQLGC